MLLKRNYASIVVIAAILLGMGLLIFRSQGLPASGQYDAFAQCLAEKGATMYGADWCPHCENEKRAFGNSFRFVPYVECPDNPKLCIEKGIAGYPTWIFPASLASGPTGLKLEGEQGLERLAEASGCELNQ